MSPGPRTRPLASTWSPRVPPAEMDAGQVLQQVPRGPHDQASRPGPHDPVPGGPLGYRNILLAGSPSPALLRSIRWGLVCRPWDRALLLVLCLCLCVCLPLTWLRETSSGMFHPVLPTGQEPLWGAANKRVGPRISAKWRVETVLRAAALGTGCGSHPHRSHEQPSKPPVWAGTGSSCAPRAPWRTCLGRGRPPFGACWLYWGAGCSSPGQRPEATWGGRGHCSDGGGGIQPLAPSVCGSGAGDWIQVQALSGGGGSFWAGSSASWPHPRPPFVGGASDTLLSAQPSCPGAAGSGASGGRLWVGSGCPSHLLPGPWWPLSFHCWLTGPPAAVREPDSVTAPNRQHWPEVATLTSWWSPQRPLGLHGTTVSWRCVPSRPGGGTAGPPGGLALSWTRRLGGVRVFPLPAHVFSRGESPGHLPWSHVTRRLEGRGSYKWGLLSRLHRGR